MSSLRAAALCVLALTLINQSLQLARSTAARSLALRLPNQTTLYASTPFRPCSLPDNALVMFENARPSSTSSATSKPILATLPNTELASLRNNGNGKHSKPSFSHEQH